jgi:beta-lactamase class A
MQSKAVSKTACPYLPYLIYQCFMTKWIIVAFILSMLFQTACMQKKEPLDDLKKEVQNKLAISNTHFGIAFKDLQTGKTLLLNEKENFHAASTMKTPVLVELFKQAAAGKFSMTDSIVIKNSFSSIVDGSEYSLDSADDSEFELYKNIGEKRSIASLAYEMIILSSNLATNLLIDLVKPDSVMTTMKKLGANDIKVLRGVEDNKAYEKGLNNTTTAYDLLLIYEQIAKEKLISAAASKEMIKILLDQRFNEIIPALLPANVKCAHKTGSITGVQHDSGIVFLPDGRKYVLVLLSRFDPADEKEVIKVMAAVSKLVYDYEESQ